MHHLHYATPVGTLAISFSSAGRLARVDWLPVLGELSTTAPATEHLPSRIQRMMREVHTYFTTGEPLDQDWVRSEALDEACWTDFQRQVYRAVLEIPQGETRTYSWVANKLGRPGASRAVGQALRRNHHLIVVPCHRVVSADDIGGFMGAIDPDAPELRFKQKLLSWEHSWRNPAFSFFEQTA
jgi:O-6-methylguanine DNA methyltransferase